MKHQHAVHSPYFRLAIELAADFAVMYLVMFTMIASVDHLLLNLNHLYMTLMMVTPMMLFMLAGMQKMFPSRRVNTALVMAAAAVFIPSFWAIRSQGGIGDEQFLRSMIPHHSGAILMCERSAISDSEIRNLCTQIVESQRREIAQMEEILKRSY